MSGTVLDGEIDVALIESDGYGYVKPLRYMAYPYDKSVLDKVRACFGKKKPDAQTVEAEKLVTDLHIEAVKAFGEQADVIGFHGQTITHDPEAGFTWQIGDGERLARETGMTCVYDMRQADIKAGGQGAPLLPLYHRALLAEHEKPVAVLNIGGVANLTYIGPDGDDDILAFDTGPGNALMDDFMMERLGVPFDKGGALASKGRAQMHLVKSFLCHEYFSRKPPKSLDRNMWNTDCVLYANDADGIATLLEMSAGSVVQAFKCLPQVPKRVYVAGGGRRNVFLMDVLASYLPMPVSPIEVLGCNGDATEAEGFAYLAVRSLLGETLSAPSTTGVKWAITGGVVAERP
jgi:anhydro-N-acetylmuramic acid kinase